MKPPFGGFAYSLNAGMFLKSSYFNMITTFNNTTE